MIGHLFDNSGARVIRFVNPVSEPHQTAFSPFDFLDKVRDVLLAPDLSQHAQHSLVRAAVEGAVQGGGCSCDRGIGIRVGASRAAHHVGAAILFVVGVENEQHLQGAFENRVGPVLQLGHLEERVEKIPGVAQVIVGIGKRETHTVPVAKGGDRGHFGNETENLLAPRLCVEDILGFRIERGQRAHDAQQHPHGMRVVAETVDKLLDVFMQQGVVLDIVHPLVELRPIGKIAIEDQVRRFEIGALLRQLLDGIAPIVQDSPVPIYKRDLAAAGGGIGETGIIR